MSTEDEMLGRLAALELIAARGLHAEMTRFFASAWPQKAEAEIAAINEELSLSLSGDALTAGTDAVRRMFERAKAPLHPPPGS